MTSFGKLASKKKSDFEEEDDDVITVTNTDEVITVDKTRYRKTKTDTQDWLNHAVLDLVVAGIRKVRVRGPAGTSKPYHDISKKHVGHMVGRCPECLPCSGCNMCGTAEDGRIIFENIAQRAHNHWLKLKEKTKQHGIHKPNPLLCISCGKDLGKISLTWTVTNEAEEYIGRIHAACTPLQRARNA